MPLHWTVSHPKRLVVAVAKGTVRPQEIRDFLARLDAEGARPYGKIFDITGSTTTFPDESVQALAALVRGREVESKVGPIAVVAGDADTFLQAQLFIAAAQLKRPIKIFREQHEARRWLDASLDAPDAAHVAAPSDTKS